MLADDLPRRRTSCWSVTWGRAAPSPCYPGLGLRLMEKLYVNIGELCARLDFLVLEPRPVRGYVKCIHKNDLVRSRRASVLSSHRAALVDPAG